MVGHDVQLRHQFRAAGAGLEGPRSCGQVVVLNVDDSQLLLDGPADRRVDVFDDLSVVLCDVILKVDHDQCAVFHIAILHKFHAPLYGGVYIRESGSSEPCYL